MRRRSAALALLVAGGLVAPVPPATAAGPERVGTPVASSGTGGAASGDTGGEASLSGLAERASALDPAGRYIVVLEPGSDVAAVAERERRRGVRAERQFRAALRGFTARLSADQKRALEADPAVASVVPDEVVAVAAQAVPTGIARVGAPRSEAAAIDGLDARVDADVAVVDTGIDPSHPDLHVAGGYDCSSSDRTRWQDRHGHGTHVAGTIGALDDGQGVVGVAPGVRLWAVKILNEEGFGYLSWYVCGLDWIAAQVDPADPSRPLFEAVNMSVAKAGRDDRNCGYSNDDILHQAICRVVARGITVVAAAANDAADAAYRVPAAYNEVITVSALADTDGRPGGLGGRACYSWGTYDVDDTFADFSNYGADVDLIAPGKCIWSTLPGGRYGNLSGTSMATPHVTGAVALYKATRPAARPADVRRALQYLGTLDWRTSTDPDGVPDRLLDVSRLGPLGTFGLAGGTGAGPASTEAGGVVTLPVSVTRSPTFFEDVSLAATDLPAGWTATFDRSVLYGFEGTSATLSVRVAPGTPVGTYRVGVTGSHAGRTSSAAYTVEVTAAPPVVRAPVVTFPGRRTVSTAAVPITVSWPAATDASGIAGYDLEEQIDGGAWRPVGSFDAAVRSVVRSAVPGRTYAYRLRASDVSGTESDWVVGPPTRALIVSERHASVAYRGTWTTYWSSSALGGTARYSSSRGATVSATLSGSEIAYVGPIGPTRGQVDVYVDGVYLKRISLYSATARSRVVLSVHRFAAAGTHRLTLRVVGTPGRPRVDVDGFIVRR